MKPRRERAAARLLLALATPLLLGRVAVAAAPGPTPPVNADLLEFLGSVDSEEPGWHDFLAGNNGRNVSRPPAAAVPPPPAPQPAPAPPARKVKDT